MRIQLMAGAAALALGAVSFTPALAQPAPAGNPVQLSGAVWGGWQYDDLNAGAGGLGSGSTHGNVWNINVGAVIPIQDHWAVQLNAGDADNTVSNVSTSVNTGYGAGSVSWVDGWGRVGGVVSYSQQSVSAFGMSPSFNSWTYGLYGDWYAMPQLTASARVGGVSGNVSGGGFGSSHYDGWYIGGQLKGYVMPDLALRGSVDYAELRQFSTLQVTDVGISGEWQVSHEYPLVLSINYNYDETNATGASIRGNSIGVGAKFFFGGPDNGPLVVRDRSGVSDEANAPLIGARAIF